MAKLYFQLLILLFVFVIDVMNDEQTKVHRNSTEYYALRQAVMEKFRARQKMIEEKYTTKVQKPLNKTSLINYNVELNNDTDSESEGNNEKRMISPSDQDEKWGECEGRIVYQHNLRLGLKGPSTLNAIVGINIQGPLCITCVESIRYNDTRALVDLHSGGRGYEFVKLNLQGFENEGFYYIIKIWAIAKVDGNCTSKTL